MNNENRRTLGVKALIVPVFIYASLGILLLLGAVNTWAAPQGMTPVRYAGPGPIEEVVVIGKRSAASTAMAGDPPWNLTAPAQVDGAASAQPGS